MACTNTVIANMAEYGSARRVVCGTVNPNGAVVRCSSCANSSPGAGGAR